MFSFRFSKNVLILKLVILSLHITGSSSHSYFDIYHIFFALDYLFSCIVAEPYAWRFVLAVWRFFPKVWLFSLISFKAYNDLFLCFLMSIIFDQIFFLRRIFFHLIQFILFFRHSFSFSWIFTVAFLKY